MHSLVLLLRTLYSLVLSLYSLVLSSYYTFLPEFTLTSTRWKQAWSTWNFNTMCTMVNDGPLHRMQSVENAAARLVTGARRSDHITPVLRQLHWLPVHQRIIFKITGPVHQSLASVTPMYLTEDCRQLSDIGRQPLRSGSNDIRLLSVPRTHNRLTDRSFTAAGPRLWTELPADLRWPNLTFLVFRQKLKTYLFGPVCSWDSCTSALYKYSLCMYTCMFQFAVDYFSRQSEQLYWVLGHQAILTMAANTLQQHAISL